MLRIIAETFVNLYAVELPQLRGRRRVDGVEPPRHRVEVLRDDVASMVWGIRSLISTQAGRHLPALRDARRAGEAVAERATAFLDHSSSSSLLDLRVGMTEYWKSKEGVAERERRRSKDGDGDKISDGASLLSI